MRSRTPAAPRRGLHRPAALGAALALLAPPAFGAELSYRWKKGDAHAFRYEADSSMKIEMPGLAMMGGGLDVRMKTDTRFVVRVLKVRPDGTAEVELEVQQLDLFSGGSKVAALQQIPERARRVKAEIDRKGRTKFYEVVTVYMRDDQYYVGVASVGPGRASAKASAGDHEVEIVASVDPKTGRVDAQMKLSEKKPALKKVKIKREDPAIDVLPKQIFEMLVLPDGDFGPDSDATLETPFGKIRVKTEAWKGDVATLSMATAMKASVATDAPDEGDSDGPAAGMMPGLDIGGMMPGGKKGKKAKAGATVDAGIDVKLETDFDVAAGRLLRVEGTVAQDVAAGGANVKTSTEFSLVRTP